MLPESYSCALWTRREYSPNHILYISVIFCSLLIIDFSSKFFSSFFLLRYLFAFCVHRCVNACTRSNLAGVFNMCTTYKRCDTHTHTHQYFLVGPKCGFYSRRLLPAAAVMARRQWRRWRWRLYVNDDIVWWFCVCNVHGVIGAHTHILLLLPASWLASKWVQRISTRAFSIRLKITMQHNDML